MYEAYFGVAVCGRGRHVAGRERPDMSGAESEQPAGNALARAGSLAGQAVRGLFAQAGHAHQDDCRNRQGYDDARDGHA
jgi:hypothetical protein